MVDPLSTRDLIKRLGTFLADLTTDRPATRIHAEISERLRETWQEPDPQLSGIYFDDKDFTAVWTAIRNGASLPINSWDTVVLPVIVYYSSKEGLKPNLETAIHLWGQARSSLSNVLEAPSPAPIVPVYEMVGEHTLDTLALPPSTPIPPERVPTPRSRRSRSKRRWLVATFASLLVVLAAVGVVLYDNATKEPYAGTLPRNDSTGFPEPITSLSPSFTESPTASPTAEPTLLPTMPTSIPPGTVAPTPPRSLASVGRTATTATLSWQPPSSVGTGGLSHYRVFKGMAEIGTAMGASFTASGLIPKTTYVFSIVAVNRAGVSSPPSNSVSVTTDAPPAPPTTPAAPKINIDPSSPIPYGMAFSISGENWPCTGPARLHVYMRDQLIATPNTDSKGAFIASIEVIFDLPNAMLRIVDRPDEYLVLNHGVVETVRVTLPNQAQCSSAPSKYLSVVFEND